MLSLFKWIFDERYDEQSDPAAEAIAELVAGMSDDALESRELGKESAVWCFECREAWPQMRGHVRRIRASVSAQALRAGGSSVVVGSVDDGARTGRVPDQGHGVRSLAQGLAERFEHRHLRIAAHDVEGIDQGRAGRQGCTVDTSAIHRGARVDGCALVECQISLGGIDLGGVDQGSVDWRDWGVFISEGIGHCDVQTWRGQIRDGRSIFRGVVPGIQ